MTTQQTSRNHEDHQGPHDQYASAEKLVVLLMRHWQTVSIAILAAAIATPAVELTRAQTANTEREILLELFHATGGVTWKRKGGWGSERPICRWEGVTCGFFADSGPITRLELWDNNLQGDVPESLVQLTDLKLLNLSGNRLTGSLASELLQRADENRLELHFWGNAISDLLTTVSIQKDDATGICLPDAQLSLAAKIDGPAGTAVYQSLHCGSARRSQRSAYCLKFEGPAPPLDDVSRALRRLTFGSARPRYESAAGVSTHQEEFRTAVAWGSGPSQVVWRFAGQAPIDIWIGQQLLLGLIPVNWERTARRVSCDALTWPAG